MLIYGICSRPSANLGNAIIPLHMTWETTTRRVQWRPSEPIQPPGSYFFYLSFSPCPPPAFLHGASLERRVISLEEERKMLPCSEKLLPLFTHYHHPPPYLRSTPHEDTVYPQGPLTTFSLCAKVDEGKKSILRGGTVSLVNAQAFWNSPCMLFLPERPHVLVINELSIWLHTHVIFVHVALKRHRLVPSTTCGMNCVWV